MKKDIHPKYNEAAIFSCECGNVVTAGSTLESYKVEICSACHPFYTGKQKLVDSAGRVEKFNAKRKAASGEVKEEKISESAKKSEKKGKYMTLDKLNKIKEKEDKKAEKRASKVRDLASKKEPKRLNEEEEPVRRSAATKKAPVKKAPAKKKPVAKKKAPAGASKASSKERSEGKTKDKE